MLLYMYEYDIPFPCVTVVCERRKKKYPLLAVHPVRLTLPTWSQDGRVYASVMTSTPGKLAKVPIKSYSSWQDLPDERSYQEILEQLQQKTLNRTKNDSAAREQYQGVLTRNRTGSLPK